MILRPAVFSEKPIIWEILQEAIEQRRLDGSEQWQDGYPNPETISQDLSQNYAYVLEEENRVIAYAAIIFGVEPAYNDIQGNWLTNGDYVVIHRVASSNSVKGRGIGTTLFHFIEDLAIKNQVYSIKVDTNFDNIPMLRILEKLNYSYCGEVFFRGSARKAFEKVLPKPGL